MGYANNGARTLAGNRLGNVDVLKGAGILLVVFGHFIEHPAGHLPLLHTLYVGIYSFHMPLFVFLAGIFAKEVLKPGDYRKIVWTLFVPLVVFQIVYVGVGRWTNWGDYPPLAPYWILWFIASLIAWRLLLPLFASPAGLLVAMLGAVLAGFDHSVGYALSASRTIYFLPFFILGHLYGMRIIESAERHRLIFATLFAASIAAVLVWWQHGLDPSALTGSHDYDGAPPDDLYPGIGRIAVMALGFTGLVGFCGLLPRRSAALEWLGKRSLSVYLLHGLVVMIVVGFGALGLIGDVWQLPAAIVLAAAVAAVTALGDGAMRRCFSPPDRQGNADVASHG